MRYITVFCFAMLAAGVAATAFRGSDVAAVPAPAPVNFKWEYRVRSPKRSSSP